MANEFKIKNGAIISGSITGVTEPTQENSTKMASTAWVKLQGYLSSLPIATASVLGAIKIGSGLAVDANGVLSIPGAAEGTLRSKQTFTATASQTTFTIAGGYTAGLIDVFLNGVLLTSTSVTATNGSTVVLIDPADLGDIVDVVVYTPLNNGFVAGTTDSLIEGTTNLFFTQARARAAVSGTAGRITYTSGVFDLATSGVTAGSYGSATAVPVVTVDAYGRITAISTSSISGALTFTGDVTGTGTTGTSTALTLANSGVTAGTYNNVATEVRPFTVDAKGRITGIGTAVTITPAWASITGKPTTISGYGITDAYTKSEIDSFLQGLDPKQSVKVATTANITLSGTQTIDGIAVVAGDRVLVKDQSTASVNGIYVVAAGAWTRATDADTAAELVSAFVFVEQGTANADSGWVCTSDNITLGTTNITFAQFSGSGAYQARLNGTGFVRMTGTTVSYITGIASQFVKADGSLDSSTYLTGNQSITLSGDATGSGTTAITVTLSNSGVTAGSYGSSSAVPVITVDAKGRVTGVTTASISGALTFTGDVTGTGTTGSSTALTLANSGVTAGTYNNVTVNAKGLVTGGSNALYLTGNQTVTISGDASGSGATSITLTLANSGVTAGTYRSVTVDAKGRVTGGTNPTTISGYGITDFYSQVISGFVVGANSTVTSADTLETAIEKLQGQVNARLTAEVDTLATVTGRGATTSTALSLTARTVTLSNFYPEYKYYFSAGALDLNWKKIADITLTTGLYVAASMEVIIRDPANNYGASTQGSPMRFIVSAQRSNGTQDTPDSGYVSGPSTDYVRLVKTALGVYEVQVRQIANYRHYMVEAMILSQLGATVTYATTPADGSTTGTIYTPTAAHSDFAANLSVLGTATANSFVKTGGTASQFLKANGTVDSNTYLTANQSITVSGDATGSGTTAITLTLANSGVTAGTYRSVTVDAKGRVTAGTTPTTISGYGITDFYSQVISGFVTGANSTVLSTDTLEVAIEKLQGQINARLTSYTETDTLATVTGRGATTSTAVTFSGGATISTLATNGATTSNEASLFLGGHNATEGGQLVLQKATSATYSYAAHLDNFQDQFRILYGSDTASSGMALSLNLANGRLQLPFYNSTTAVTGTVVGYLAFDANGNILTVASSGGGGTTLNGTGFVRMSGTTASYITGTASQFVKADGTLDSNAYITSASVGNGTLTLAVSGTGLSGSATFTANQSGNTTFTVTSNATNANTGSTIVARDASGNFSAGTITAALSGNATTATNISNTGTVTLGTSTEQNDIYITAPSYTTDTPVKLLNFNWYSNIFSMGNIRSGGTASNGFGFYYTASGGSRVEIARFSTSGNLTVGGTFTEQSSIRYKENIFTLQDCLSTVTKLRGVEYNRKGVTVKEIGVIAEEVHAILPEVINYNDQNEIDSVSYARLTAVLIEAVKEQQQQINELKALLGK